MPFDPTLPAHGAPLVSAEIRSQFNGLKELIDAAPGLTGVAVDAVTTVNPGEAATVSLSVVDRTLHFSFGLPRGSDGSSGMNGSDGAPGAPFTNFLVDGITTLNPGEVATANASFDGSAVRLSFALPRGSDGSNGMNGNDGGQGPPGAPFTNFMVDGITTLNPGEAAMASASFDGSAVRLSFAIPRGSDGSSGMNGMNGSDGSQGPPGPPFANAVVDGVSTLSPWENATVQTNFDGSNVRFQFGIPRGNDGAPGPPGEVTNAQLASAIAGTSNLSNAVATLGMTVSDPPTPSEMQAIANKLDELITALRR